MRTRYESEEPVEETVWTLRTAMARTRSPCIARETVLDTSTYFGRRKGSHLGNEVVDMPHILIIFRPESDITLYYVLAPIITLREHVHIHSPNRPSLYAC